MSKGIIERPLHFPVKVRFKLGLEMGQRIQRVAEKNQISASVLWRVLADLGVGRIEKMSAEELLAADASIKSPVDNANEFQTHEYSVKLLTENGPRYFGGLDEGTRPKWAKVPWRGKAYSWDEAYRIAEQFQAIVVEYQHDQSELPV